ncbi:MAG: hypothetical protein V7629_08075 [Motiliproteus sp.]
MTETSDIPTTSPLSVEEEQVLRAAIESEQTQLKDNEFNGLCHQVSMFRMARASYISLEPPAAGRDTEILGKMLNDLKKVTERLPSLTGSARDYLRDYDFDQHLEAGSHADELGFSLSPDGTAEIFTDDINHLVNRIEFAQRRLDKEPKSKGRNIDTRYSWLIQSIAMYVQKKIPWMTLSYQRETPFYCLITEVLYLFGEGFGDRQRHIKAALSKLPGKDDVEQEQHLDAIFQQTKYETPENKEISPGSFPS